MDLAELKFRVNTEELDQAAKKVAELGTSVNNLNVPIDKLSKNSSKVAKALKDAGDASHNVSQQTTAAGHNLDRIGTIIEKAAQSMRVLRNQSVDAADGALKLGEGFTKAQSNMLAQLKLLGATSDQMQALAKSYKEYNDISGLNTFDKSASGLAKMSKEVAELNRVNALTKQGLNLTREEIVLLSRDMLKMEQVYAAGTKELIDAQNKLQAKFVAIAQERNILLSQAKESEAQAKREASMIKANSEMMDQAVLKFRENELMKQKMLEKTNADLEKQRSILALMKEGYTQSEAGQIVRFQDKGLGSAEIKDLINQRRALVKATNDQHEAERLAQAQAAKTAQANEYLIDVEKRLDAQISETNRAMQERHTNQLLKIDRAIQMTGMSSVDAAKKMEVLRAKMEQVAGKQQQQQLEHLARAISVQMGDVAISLASGMNPLLVMIQQGDQIRGAIQQAGAEGKVLQSAMMTAAAQIATSFMQTGKAIGTFFTGAIVKSGEAIMSMGISMLGLSKVMRDIEVSVAILDSQGIINGKTFEKGLRAAAISAGLALTSLLVVFGALAVESVKIMNATTEMNRSLVMTGASLGLTQETAVKYAESMQIAGTNTLQVIRTLGEVAKISNVPKDALDGIIRSAIELEKYGGQAVDKTVASFARLKDDPVKALTDLAKETGNVRVETIAYVDKLVDTGQKSKAVEVAMKAQAAAYSEAAKTMKDSLNPLQKLWVEIKEDIEKAKQALYDFATDETTVKAFKLTWSGIVVLFLTLSKVVGDVARDIKFLSEIKSLGFSEALDRRNEAQNKASEDYRKTIDLIISGAGEIKTAEEKASAATQNLSAAERKLNVMRAEALENYKKSIDGAKDKTTQYQKEVSKLIAHVTKAKMLGIDVDQNEVNAAMEALRKKYVKQSEGEKAYEKALRASIKAQEDAKASLWEVNSAERQLMELKASPDWAKFTAREKKQLEVNYLRASAILEEKKVVQAAIKAIQDYNDEWEKNADIKREAMQWSKQLDAATDDETKKLALEARLLFTSSEERQRQIKLFEAEVNYRKQLLKINQEEAKLTNPTKEDRAYFDRLRRDAADRYEQVMKNVNTAIAQDYVEKMIEGLRSGLTDAITTFIFEGGKAGAKKLRDVIVAELRKKVTIQVEAIVNTVMQSGVNLVAGLTGNGNNDTSGALGNYASLVNTGSSAYKLGSSLYSGYQSGGVAGAWNSVFGGTSLGVGAGGWSTGAYTSLANSQVLAAYGVEGAGATAGGVTAGSSAATSSAFTSASAAAVYAILAYMGIKLSSKWFREGFTGNDQLNNGGLDTALYAGSGTMEGQYILSKWFGLSEEWSNILSGATGINKLIGMAKAKPEAYGITGKFSGEGDFSGEAYQDFYQKGGVFRKSKWWTETAKMPDEINNLMDKVGKETLRGVKAYGEALGLTTDQLSSVTADIKIEFGNFKDVTTEVGKLSEKYGEDLTKPFEQLSKKGKEVVKSVEYLNAVTADAETNAKKLADAAQLYANALVETFGPQVKEFALLGETTVQTIERLSGNLKSMNEVMQLAGLKTFDKSLAGANKATEFANVFGGKDNAVSALNAYYEAVYTEEEKAAKQLELLKNAFSELGITMPSSVAGLRQMVESAQAAGDSELVAQLVMLAPAFTSIKEAVGELLTTAQDVKDKFSGLADKFLEGDELKNFRIDEIVSVLAKAGIKMTDDAVEAMTASELYQQVMEYFNAGMFDKANALLDVVNMLEGADLAFGKSTKAGARKGVEAARDALVASFDAQIELIDKQIDAAQAAVSSAQAGVNAAEQAVSNAQASVEEIKKFREGIADLRSELYGKLAAQSPVKLFQNFIDATDRAKKGDLTSLGDIQETSKAYVGYAEDTARNYIDYVRELAKVQAVLSGVEDATGGQLTQQEKGLIYAQQSLDFAQANVNYAQSNLAKLEEQKRVLEAQKEEALRQVDVLLGIDESIKTIPEAIAALGVAMENYKNVQTQAPISYQPFVDPATKPEVKFVIGPVGPNDTKTSAASQAEAIKEKVVGPTLGFMPITNPHVNSGESSQNSTDSEYRDYVSPEAFAKGGSYNGGLAVVGETGKEMINFDRPGTVYTASQTSSILGNTEVLDALIEVRDVVKDLIETTKSGNVDINKLHKLLDRLSPDGDSLSVSFPSPQEVTTV